MALRTIIAISKKTYNTSLTAYKIDGVNFSGGGIDRTASEWLNQISIDGVGSTGGLFSFNYAEFNTIDLTKTIEFVDTTIAEMLGFLTGVVYTGYNVATKWGSSKLLLQNSVNPSPLSNSILQSFEEMAGDFENNNVILRGFAPISDYEASNDREFYSSEVRFFPASRRDDLKLFLEETGKGIGQTVNIYGLSFKISESLDLNIDLSQYKGLKDQYSNKNLKEFSLGFIVGV